MGKTLLNELNAVIAKIESGYLQTALNQLQHDVLSKTDGCATTGRPDANDWIRTCAQQAELRAEILVAIDRIEQLL